jgi:hypothetical protein
MRRTGQHAPSRRAPLAGRGGSWGGGLPPPDCAQRRAAAPVASAFCPGAGAAAGRAGTQAAWRRGAGRGRGRARAAGRRRVPARSPRMESWRAPPAALEGCGSGPRPGSGLITILQGRAQLAAACRAGGGARVDTRALLTTRAAAWGFRGRRRGEATASFRQALAAAPRGVPHAPPPASWGRAGRGTSTQRPLPSRSPADPLFLSLRRPRSRPLRRGDAHPLARPARPPFPPPPRLPPRPAPQPPEVAPSYVFLASEVRGPRQGFGGHPPGPAPGPPPGPAAAAAVPSTPDPPCCHPEPHAPPPSPSPPPRLFPPPKPLPPPPGRLLLHRPDAARRRRHAAGNLRRPVRLPRRRRPPNALATPCRRRRPERGLCPGPRGPAGARLTQCMRGGGSRLHGGGAPEEEAR